MLAEKTLNSSVLPQFTVVPFLSPDILLQKSHFNWHMLVETKLHRLRAKF